MSDKQPQRHPAELADKLAERLAKLRLDIKTDPLSNPVRELSHEISRELESSKLSLDDVKGLVDYLDIEAFGRRAEHVTSYLAQGDYNTLDEAVAGLSKGLDDLSSFTAFWQARRETIVFTGHPTFILSQAARIALAAQAQANAVPAQSAGLPDTPITLGLEHSQAEKALVCASDSIFRLSKSILKEAKKRFPDDWQSIRPNPIGVGTWVGYDMDGRTDIGWPAVILHRLHEKQLRLDLYIRRLSGVGGCVASVTDQLRLARDLLDAHIAAFSQNLDDPQNLAAAANRLTTEKAQLTSLTPIIESLSAIASASDEATALEVHAICGEMAACGLGMGEVHFRLNAAQIRHAARDLLGVSSDNDLFGRGALEEISTLIANASPLRVNFASLANERASSARLFIAMAQILKHIDADSPIRLLIAECENPVTVLAAIYQAKLFGVDHNVDVCPLFETALSLDRGRRILDVLFRQPAYRAHVERRGRIAIETGFSDAGRFMGQIPACLAIE
ncbi:MAG: phosphoenolpyruvate carboxylase, partial [Pseudomonadota bacterium]